MQTINRFAYKSIVWFFLFQSFVGFGNTNVDSLLLIARDTTNPVFDRLDNYLTASFVTVYNDPQIGQTISKEYLQLANQVNDCEYQKFALHYLGYTFLTELNLDSALYTYLKQLHLAIDNNDDHGMAMGYADVGIAYEALGDNEKALDYHQKCLKLSLETKNNMGVARSLINIGGINELRGNFKESLMNFQQALEVSLANGYSGYYATIYRNLGKINFSIGEISKAEKYLEKAIEYSNQFSNNNTKFKALVDLADLNNSKGSFDKGLKYYFDALEVANENEFQSFIGVAQFGIADTYSQTEQIEEALLYIDSSLIKLKEENDTANLYMAQIIGSEIYLKKGDVFKSLELANNGFVKAELNNDLKYLTRGTFSLFNAYKQKGDNEKALHFHEKYVLFKEKVRTRDEIRDVVKMEISNEFKERALLDSIKTVREKEAIQIQHQEKIDEQKKYSFIALTGLGVLLLAFIFAMISYRQKQKSNLKLAEKNKIIEGALKDKEVLLKEIHHRVKNNMQMISGLLHLKSKSSNDIEVKDALTDSQSRIYSLALVHQKMYQNDNYEQINVTEYCRDIMKVLVNSLTKEGGVFEVTGKDIYIDVEQAQAIGFIIHELLTNSMKYAWGNQGDKRISVICELEGSEMTVHYMDNGKGLPEDFSLSEANSMGLKLVNSFTKRQLKGKVKVYNKEGANFVVTFVPR